MYTVVRSTAGGRRSQAWRVVDLVQTSPAKARRPDDVSHTECSQERTGERDQAEGDQRENQWTFGRLVPGGLEMVGHTLCLSHHRHDWCERGPEAIPDGRHDAARAAVTASGGSRHEITGLRAEIRDGPAADGRASGLAQLSRGHLAARDHDRDGRCVSLCTDGANDQPVTALRKRSPAKSSVEPNLVDPRVRPAAKAANPLARGIDTHDRDPQHSRAREPKDECGTTVLAARANDWP